MRTPTLPVLRRPLRVRGVSLIEVMVGMAVGLVASLVIMRSFTASETFRRNVGGVADSVQTAAISGARLNMLFEEAGASFVQGRNVWGCKLAATRNKAALFPAGSYPDPFGTFPKQVRVMPVGILDGGDANSDIVAVMSGSSAASNRSLPFDSSDGKSLTVTNPNGIGTVAGAVDDLILSVPQDVAGGPGTCQIVQVASDFSGGTAVSDASLGLKVMPAEAAVVAPASYTLVKLNLLDTSYGALASVADSPSAFHLGREAAVTFSLISVNSNGELVEYDLLQRRGVQSFGENVVLLKARYGVAPPNSEVINEWIAPSEWTLSSLMDGSTGREQMIDRIKAIRIGVAVRSSQIVNTEAKLTQLVLFGDQTGVRKFSRDLTTDEQRYAYQVYDWVIPLRNMKATPK